MVCLYNKEASETLTSDRSNVPGNTRGLRLDTEHSWLANLNTMRHDGSNEAIPEKFIEPGHGISYNAVCIPSEDRVCAVRSDITEHTVGI